MYTHTNTHISPRNGILGSKNVYIFNHFWDCKFTYQNSKLGRPNFLYISQHPEVDALGFCGSNYILFFIKYECKMWPMICPSLYLLNCWELFIVFCFVLFCFWHTQNIVCEMYMLHAELIKCVFWQGNRRTGRIKPVERWRAAPITPVLSKGASEYWVYLFNRWKILNR